MKIAIVTIMLGVAVAGSAIAAQGVTDIDYIRASRCKGLAAGSGLADTKGLDEYLKSASRGRMEIAEDRAQSEFERARRETRSDEGKAHYAAELAGACRPYMGGPQSTAQVGGAKDTATR
jgi:hypothetical protein